MPAGAIGPARQRLLSGCRTSAGWSWDQQILPLPMPHDGYVLQIPAIVTVLSTQASIAVVEVVLPVDFFTLRLATEVLRRPS